MSGQSHDEHPDWWDENDDIRMKLGLPDYDPPRFEDGIYTYEVISDLEDRHDVEIRFVGVNTKYGDDWEVRVNGVEVLTIGRYRDMNGNTIYEMTADAFVDILEDEISES